MSSTPGSTVAAFTLKNRIQAELSHMDPFFAKVRSDVEGAQVRLSGTVESAYEKELAEFLIRQLAGVEAIKNEIVIFRTVRTESPPE